MTSSKAKIVRYGSYELEKLHEWCVKHDFSYSLIFRSDEDCFDVVIKTGKYDVKVYEFYSGQAAIDYIETATTDLNIK